MTPSLHKLEWKEGTPLLEYEIEKELLHGTLGTIYSCIHRDNRSRAAMVVVKTVNGRLASDPVSSPLLDGLETVRELAHPNLASITELWHFEELFFLISEYPNGTPLSDALSVLKTDPGAVHNKDSRRSPARIVRLLRDVTAILSDAHDHGLTHQDLRSDDIFVGEDGSLMLLGLGWAPLLGRQESTGNGPNRPALNKSKPTRNDLREKIQADVAAVGKILVRCITGREPADETYGSGGTRLPAGLDRIYERTQGNDPACNAYPAAALYHDLDRSIELLEGRSSTKKKSRLPATVLQRLFGRRKRFAAISVVFTLILVCLTASLSVTSLFSSNGKFPSLKKQISRTTAAARHRRERAADFMEQGCWSAALADYLVVHYLDGAQFLGDDLLDLATRMLDGGQTQAADRIFDQVIDWHAGTEWAMRALLMKKRLVLDETALHGLARSLERLLEGPFAHEGLFREMAQPLIGLARSLHLERYTLTGRSWIVGDFLPGRGDEIATLQSCRLIVHGRESSLEIALPEDPVRISAIEQYGSGQDKIALSYASGRMEIFDPVARIFESAFEIRGHLQNGVILFPGTTHDSDGTGDHAEDTPDRIVLSAADEKGIDLVLLDESMERQGRRPHLFRFEGTGLCALIPLDPLPSIPGRCLLVLIDTEIGTRISLLAFRESDGRWQEYCSESIPERVGAALAVHNKPGAPPKIVLGVTASMAPPAEGRRPGRRPGIYALSILSRKALESTGEIARFGPLVPLKIVDPGMHSGGVTFPGACRGDMNGNFQDDAVFLVRFPGCAEQGPETRLLWYRDGQEFLWLYGADARALRCGDLDGAPGEEMLLDQGAQLLGVSCRPDGEEDLHCND